MEITGGSCRLGLWHVHVWWNDKRIDRIRFSRTAVSGPVPALIRKYCAGIPVDLRGLPATACEGDSVTARIYRAVREIGYGSTATYGEIAAQVGTSPRVVGWAMSRNPTPLIIPCHRVVAANGIGGFSPALEIKEYLIDMEKKKSGRRKDRNEHG